MWLYLWSCTCLQSPELCQPVLWFRLDLWSMREKSTIIELISLEDRCYRVSPSVSSTYPWCYNSRFKFASLMCASTGVRYYYTVGDVFGMSTERSFLAPLEPGSELPFGFFVFGDLGQVCCWTMTQFLDLMCLFVLLTVSKCEAFVDLFCWFILAAFNFKWDKNPSLR